MDNYKVIPERIILEGAQEVGGANNSFTRLSGVANEFREAGLDPIYIYDPQSSALMVIVEETYRKKLH